MTQSELALTISTLIFFALFMFSVLMLYCLRRHYTTKIADLTKRLDATSSERAKAKSFANALTNAYDTNVDAERIQKEEHRLKRKQMNEEYLQKDAFVNSDLPEDLRADTGAYNGNAKSGLRDPMLEDDHRVVSDDDNLLAHQPIVKAISSEFEEDPNAPMSMSSAAALSDSNDNNNFGAEMMRLNKNENRHNNNNGNNSNDMERVNSQSPPNSPPGRENNTFNIAQEAMRMRQQKQQGSPILSGKKAFKKNWKALNSKQKNNNNNNGYMPPMPPVPPLPPNNNNNNGNYSRISEVTSVSSLPEPNMDALNDYDNIGSNDVAAAAAAAENDSDDDIIMPPKDGLAKGITGAPPPGRSNLQHRAMAPKKVKKQNQMNPHDIAVGMALRMSVDEGGARGAGAGQVEGLAKSLKNNGDLLALNDEDDMFDDMYAPANENVAAAGGGMDDTPGDGGEHVTTPGAPGAGGPPPKPIVEDDDIDVLDV